MVKIVDGLHWFVMGRDCIGPVEVFVRTRYNVTKDSVAHYAQIELGTHHTVEVKAATRDETENEYMLTRYPEYWNV